MSGGAWYHTPLWSIQIANGWWAEDHGDHIRIITDEPDVVLRFTSFELPPRLTASGWIELVAQGHRPKGRTVTDVACGDFHGMRTEFAVMDSIVPPRLGDRWLRGWTLECDGTPLDVTYRCPLWCAGRYDEVVVAMLSTLRAGSRIRRAAP